MLTIDSSDGGRHGFFKYPFRILVFIYVSHSPTLYSSSFMTVLIEFEQLGVIKKVISSQLQNCNRSQAIKGA